VTTEAVSALRGGEPETRPFLERVLATKGGVIAARLLVIGVILALWQFVPVARGTKFWLSSPSQILSTLWSWIADGSIWIHLEATLTVMALGYVIGCASGIVIGLLLGFLPRVHRVLTPYISGLYALPKIALAPLFIILLGIGVTSKVALVAITVFFLLLTNTIDGVRDVDRDLVRLLNLMGATRLEIIRKVLIPGALPWIFTGMRISVRYAFTNTLLAELIAANRGLGFLIEYNSGNFNATGSYAAILVLVLFSVALTELLMRLEKLMSRRGA
jgi:NitT/TauT family transport system permease protein